MEFTKSHDEKLTMLQEECAEVIVALSKVKRFGYGSRYPADGPSNMESLHSEIIDILAVLYALGEEGGVCGTWFKDALYTQKPQLKERWEKKLKYTKHQKSA